MGDAANIQRARTDSPYALIVEFGQDTRNRLADWAEQQVSTERIPIACPERWREVLRNVPHAFGHTWESCYAFSLTSNSPTYLYHFKAGEISIVCALAEREFAGSLDLVTSYGFSGFVGNGYCPAFPSHWSKYVKENDYVCGYITLNPFFPAPAPFEKSRPHNTLFALDLSISKSELESRLDRNRRRELREWAREGEPLVVDQAVLTDFLLAQHPSFLERVNARRTHQFTDATLSALCSSDNVLLVGAQERGNLVAVYVFGYTAAVVDCLLNVAVPEGRRYTTALVSYGVDRFKEMGIPWLNFGGGVRPNDSLAQAKMRFGGHPMPITALRQVYKPSIYAELSRTSGVSGAETSDFFPPYHRP